MKFDPDMNYPVCISEPLVSFSLSSLFEKQSWVGWPNCCVTTRRLDSNLRGHAFRAHADFLGKFQSSRGRAGDEIATRYHAGGSDHFRLKANSPADVLTTRTERPFFCQVSHVGPELLCFLQDEETKELAVFAMQEKVSPTL